MARLTWQEIANIRGYASLSRIQKHKRPEITPSQLEELAQQLLDRERDIAELTAALSTLIAVLPKSAPLVERVGPALRKGKELLARIRSEAGAASTEEEVTG